MKKDLIALAVIVAILTAIMLSADFQSVDSYYNDHAEDIKPESETVFITVKCNNILTNYEMLDKNLKSEKYVPKDGIILHKTEFVLRKGDTVFDMTKRVAKYKKIHLEFSGNETGSYSSIYIQGMNNIYEFSCGPLSGWLYKVNGNTQNLSCSQYELKDGDVIEWVYSCDLGHDVGAVF